MNNPVEKNKNGSFMFGKGKQNKKNVVSIRGVIQQARQAHETYQTLGQVTPNTLTKKCNPSHLEPLNKPELNQKL